MQVRLLHRFLQLSKKRTDNHDLASKETALAQRFSGAPLPPIAGIDQQLQSIIQKACSYTPEARFSSPTEMGPPEAGPGSVTALLPVNGTIPLLYQGISFPAAAGRRRRRPLQQDGGAMTDLMGLLFFRLHSTSKQLF